MDNPLDRRMRQVADRIGGFLGQDVQLRGGRDELPGDGVQRIGGVDQLHHGRRDRHGVLRGDPFQRREPLGRDKAGGGQRLGAAEGFDGHRGHMGHRPLRWQLFVGLATNHPLRPRAPLAPAPAG